METKKAKTKVKAKKQKTVDLITVQDVATNEKVSTKTVYEWVKEEKISPVHYVGINKQSILIGRAYKVDRENKN